MSKETLTGAFFETVKNYGSKISLKTKKDGEYHGITYNELGQRVKNFALGLASFGIKKSDKVAILSENRAEWAISDLAILSLGAVNVPIYPTLTPKQIEFILNNADVKIIVVSTKELLKKVEEIFDNLPLLQQVIYIEKIAHPKEYMFYFDFVYEKGKEFDNKNPDYFEEVKAVIEADDPCAIVYTSGTTGKPKGAVLSHRNIFANANGGVHTLIVKPDDVFLSFLPLCHVFERMAGQFCPLLVGASIAYAESIDTVADNLVEVKPTIVCSVPRLFEKIYAKVMENAKTGSFLKRKIFEWAVKVGEKYSQAKNENKISAGLKVKHNLASKLVYSKIQEKVGGNLRFFVSGGAALAKEIGQFFDIMGVKILEGYGLTESSPVISVNLEDNYKFGTVGPAMTKSGVQVKIANDGEILSRGPHIMKGYYKNPQATKEIIDEEGWLHTGDIGFIDDDGYLTITDRKKNIIVTAGGKNIAPALIESMLATSPLIEQVLIIGDKRKYLSALIVPNLDMIKSYARRKKIKYDDINKLVEQPEIFQYVDRKLKKLTSELARFQKIKTFKLIPDLFTIENDELTPTLKIKRKVVEKKYADLIEQMYD